MGDRVSDGGILVNPGSHAGGVESHHPRHDCRGSPGFAHVLLKELQRALQEDLVVALFHRRGGRLILTETGQDVLRYAEEIFTLGQELQASLQGRAPARFPRLVVGVSDVIPKLIAERLLDPAVRLPEEIQLVCQEDRPERLLSELSAHAMDVVLTDAPAGPQTAVRAYSHLLGESGISIFASAPLAGRLFLRKGPTQSSTAPARVPPANHG